MPPSPRITIRLTPALEALLSDDVRQGHSVSDIVREALEAYLQARPTARPTDCQTPEEPLPASESVPLSDMSDIPPFDTMKFVLGPLCKKKHQYYGTGQTLRRVKSHGCPQCDVERTRAKRKAKRAGGP